MTRYELLRTLECPYCKTSADLIIDGKDLKGSDGTDPNRLSILRDYKFDRAGVVQYYQCPECLTIFGRFIEYLNTGAKINVPVSKDEYVKWFFKEWSYKEASSSEIDKEYKDLTGSTVTTPPYARYLHRAVNSEVFKSTAMNIIKDHIKENNKMDNDATDEYIGTVG